MPQGDCTEMFRYEHHKNIGHYKEVLILTLLTDDFKLFLHQSSQS